MKTEKVPCDICGKKISSIGLGIHKYYIHGITKKKPAIQETRKNAEEETKKQALKEHTEEERIQIATSKPIVLSGRSIALLELLINVGYGKNQHEVVEKLLQDNTPFLMNVGGMKMEGEKKEKVANDPIDKMERLVAMQGNQAMLKMFANAGGDTNKPPKTKSEFLEFMKDQLELKAMQKAFAGDQDFNIKDLLQFTMIQNLMGSSKTDSRSPDSIALQQQLAGLQSQLQQQKLEFERTLRDKEVTNAINSLKEGLTNKKDIDPTEVIKLVTDKLEAVEKQKLETQKERDLRREQEITHLKDTVKRDIKDSMKGSGIGQAIQDKIENQIIESFDFDKIINKKEDAWEKAAKIFQPTIDKVADIVITEQQRKMQQEAYKYGVPIHTPEDNISLGETPEETFSQEGSSQESKANIQVEEVAKESSGKFYTGVKRSFFPEDTER